MSDSAIIHPASRLHGAVRVPGDKSISHRVAMFSAISVGESEICGFLASEDCVNTLGALEAMGARVSRYGTDVTVAGTGGEFQAPPGPLDLGNSGTGMRLLAGLVAGQPFRVTMTGDTSLRSRPMRRIQEPLELMGARVELLGENGCAPVRISGGRLRGIEYVSPVASAQVKSCVLLAGLFADGATSVTEPKATRDHTEKLLQAMGVPVETKGRTVRVEGYGPRGPRAAGRRWVVPGDFSSAAFWIGAAAAMPGAEVTIESVGLNPRRTALLDVLTRMGADLTVASEAGGAAGEAMGRVTVRGAGLRGTETGGEEIPNLIDELPLVASLGALAEGRTVIRDASELRVKESDRITAMVESLQRLGVGVEERPDGMVVTGRARLRAGEAIDSRGDHRIAMAMTVLALFADAPVRIHGTECIATSYPEFWDHLEALGGHAERYHHG